MFIHCLRLCRYEQLKRLIFDDQHHEVLSSVREIEKHIEELGDNACQCKIWHRIGIKETQTVPREKGSYLCEEEKGNHHETKLKNGLAFQKTIRRADLNLNLEKQMPLRVWPNQKEVKSFSEDQEAEQLRKHQTPFIAFVLIAHHSHSLRRNYCSSILQIKKLRHRLSFNLPWPHSRHTVVLSFTLTHRLWPLTLQHVTICKKHQHHNDHDKAPRMMNRYKNKQLPTKHCRDSKTTKPSRVKSQLQNSTDEDNRGEQVPARLAPASESRGD